MPLSFRPHHFLCALNFEGRGYSSAFVKNFSDIVDILNAPDGNEVVINVIDHTDSICKPCPERIHTKCQAQETVLKLDKAHANALDIQTNTKITWGHAKARIAEKITLDIFHSICAGCSWKPSGLCEASLKKFLRK